MLINLTVNLFSRIRYYDSHFIDKEDKTQQVYTDAEKNN